jgi:hypothetical protein
MGDQEIKNAVALAAVEIKDYLDGPSMTEKIRARVDVTNDGQIWDALNELMGEKVLDVGTEDGAVSRLEYPLSPKITATIRFTRGPNWHY